MGEFLNALGVIGVAGGVLAIVAICAAAAYSIWWTNVGQWRNRP